MKIKIVRRTLKVSQITPPSKEPVEVYDIYYGFRGITSLFVTKWFVQRMGLEESELMEVMKNWLTSVGTVKIKVETAYFG